MADYHTFTGGISETTITFCPDQLVNPILPEIEETWLEEHPQQIARVWRTKVRVFPTQAKYFSKRKQETHVLAHAYGFSLRIFDPRQKKGWRVGTIYLLGNAPYNVEADWTLDGVWRKFRGDPAKENTFVLTALNEAAYVDAFGANIILRSIVLPDPSLLDPDDWGLDFTPYTHRT